MSRQGSEMFRLLGKMMERREDLNPALLRMASLFMKYAPGQMTCSEFEGFLLDYYEGRLSSRERYVFEIHMRVCPMCRVYFESYLRTIELLGPRLFEDADASVPSDIPEELIEAILAAREGG